MSLRDTPLTASRRNYIKTAATVGALSTVAGCLGGLGGDDDGELTLGFTTHFTSGAWVSALVDGVDIYAQTKGFDYNLFTTGGESQQQIQDMRQMIDQGFDAIILVPFSTEDIAGVVEEAAEEGIPVFTLDIDAATPEAAMLVSWDDQVAAGRAAELLVQELRSQNPGQESFEVLEVRAPPGRDISRLRHEPFVERVDQTADVEIAGTVNGEWVRETADQRTREWVNANGPPDGVYSASFAMGLGAVRALDELDLLYPNDQDDHIVAVQLDGSSETHDLIKDGFIDGAIDQPVHYYGPIAVEYVERFVQGDGLDELPNEGDEITADDLSIDPTEHPDREGQILWEDPIWAPATVGESFGHRHFITNHVEISPGNADSPNLWGNNWG